MEEWKTTKIRRSTLLRLRSVKQRFGFASLDEVFVTFLAIRDKKCWDRGDMICMSKYGKLPEIDVAHGTTDKECLRKLGLGGPKTEKISESELPDAEKIGKLSKDLLMEKEGKKG